MKKILFLIPLFFACLAQAQVTNPIYGDTVKVTSRAGDGRGNLVLDIPTKGIKGFLYNTGNGITVFKKLVKLNDSTYLLGSDTLKLNDKNFAKDNLVFNGDRTHDLNGHGLTLANGDTHFTPDENTTIDFEGGQVFASVEGTAFSSFLLKNNGSIVLYADQAVTIGSTNGLELHQGNQRFAKLLNPDTTNKFWQTDESGNARLKDVSEVYVNHSHRADSLGPYIWYSYARLSDLIDSLASLRDDLADSIANVRNTLGLDNILANGNTSTRRAVVGRLNIVNPIKPRLTMGVDTSVGGLNYRIDVEPSTGNATFYPANGYSTFVDNVSITSRLQLNGFPDDSRSFIGINGGNANQVPLTIGVNNAAPTFTPHIGNIYNDGNELWIYMSTGWKRLVNDTTATVDNANKLGGLPANNYMTVDSFANKTKPYYLMASKTEDNLPFGNTLEGNLWQYSGDTIIHAFKNTPVGQRAEYANGTSIAYRYSTDKGYTYSTPVNIKTGVNRGIETPFISTIGSRIVVVYKPGQVGDHDSTSSETSLFATDSIMLMYSDDFGSTWTDAAPIKSSVAGRMVCPSTPVMLWGDGKYHFLAWCHKVIEHYVSNDGITGYTSSTVVDSTTAISGTDEIEASAVYLGHDSVRMLVRNNVTGVDNRPLVYVSANNGSTWSYYSKIDFSVNKPWQYPSRNWQNIWGNSIVTAIGQRNKNTSPTNENNDSVLVYIDDAAALRSNPAKATLVMTIPRPVPNASFFKGEPSLAPNKTGLTGAFIESTILKDTFSYGAKFLRYYTFNIGLTNGTYNLAQITGGYPGAAPVYNSRTRNYDFIVPVGVANRSVDSTLFIDPNAIKSVVISSPSTMSQTDSATVSLQTRRPAGDWGFNVYAYGLTAMRQAYSLGNVGVGALPLATSTGKNLVVYNNLNTGSTSSNASVDIISAWRNPVFRMRSQINSSQAYQFTDTTGNTLYAAITRIASGTESALKFSVNGYERANIDTGRMSISAVLEPGKSYAQAGALALNVGTNGAGSSVSEMYAMQISSGFSQGTTGTYGIWNTMTAGTNRYNWYGSGGASFANLGQGVFGSTSITTSAQLSVNSTTKGFLPPRMTTAQRTAISSPAEGLMVYDTDLHKLYVWDATAWQAAW